ncbi:MAG: molybdenum cofactor guanylyltransferase [Firmicutes bacterium HGW-Firmicutes-15]|nr:MAG: molybdenum cofactor guanylyltransferase [Firmicutes bacterium HGW-Firmicutes-15]
MKASGVILAGGKSSRMKFNKAFAEIDGRLVINIIIDKFAGLFEETIIISNEPELYCGLGPVVYTDIYPRMGPVSGIHSGLYHARHDQSFILGCDVPFMNMELVEYMFSQLGDYDSVVPEIDTYLQPLSAVYSKKCLPVLTNCLENNKVKLIRIFEELNSLVLNRNELEKFGLVEELFLNVNDLEALNMAKRIAGRYQS